MNFNWNIDTWGVNETPEEIRKEPWLSFVKALLYPVKYLYDLFLPYRAETLKKMRYNSQTIILENLLNDLFDNTLRRIRVITTYDIVGPIYLYEDVEDKPIWIYDESEYTADPNLVRVWLYENSELGVLYDFIVEAAPGSLTDEQIVRLKATVNYYRLAGKKPGYFYSNGIQY
ncbi:MAG: hypothetical protein U0T74_05885 [Chitinophagales bacterium]